MLGYILAFCLALILTIAYCALIVGARSEEP